MHFSSRKVHYDKATVLGITVAEINVIKIMVIIFHDNM